MIDIDYLFIYFSFDPGTICLYREKAYAEEKDEIFNSN